MSLYFGRYISVTVSGEYGRWQNVVLRAVVDFRGRQGSGMKICNIERGLPTVGQAHKRIEEEIAAAKFGKWTCMKLIHGYGSSGRRRNDQKFASIVFRCADAQGQYRTISGANDFQSSFLYPRALLRYPDLSGDAGPGTVQSRYYDYFAVGSSSNPGRGLMGSLEQSLRTISVECRKTPDSADFYRKL